MEKGEHGQDLYNSAQSSFQWQHLVQICTGIPQSTQAHSDNCLIKNLTKRGWWLILAVPQNYLFIKRKCNKWLPLSQLEMTTMAVDLISFFALYVITKFKLPASFLFIPTIFYRCAGKWWTFQSCPYMTARFVTELRRMGQAYRDLGLLLAPKIVNFILPGKKLKMWWLCEIFVSC